jgi:hypothetical protein
MFAPDHARTAAELVRVCRPGGRIVMTTWINDGFAGEMFNLSGRFLPPPPEGLQSPPLWGGESHVIEMFGAAGATPTIARETVEFPFASVQDAANEYADDFGPFVVARGELEPQGRWDAFIGEFAEIIARFNIAADGTATLRSDYFVVTVDR